MIKKILHGAMPEAADLIPEKDLITFSVLHDVVRHDCDYIASDGDGFIICTTVSRYPVWIWCAEGREKELCGTVLDLLNTDIPERKQLNLSGSFLRELKALDNGHAYRTVVSMLAYDCPEPVAPAKCPEGTIRIAGPDDIPSVVEMDRLFYSEISSQTPPSEAELLEAEKERVAEGHTYLWITPEGQPAAKCCYLADEKSARISGVYTYRDHRRHGYAEQLVYRATCDVLASGKDPCLYTDADYIASNACYTGIGYVLRGDLVTVERS